MSFGFWRVLHKRKDEEKKQKLLQDLERIAQLGRTEDAQGSERTIEVPVRYPVLVDGVSHRLLGDSPLILLPSGEHSPANKRRRSGGAFAPVLAGSANAGGTPQSIGRKENSMRTWFVALIVISAVTLTPSIHAKDAAKSQEAANASLGRRIFGEIYTQGKTDLVINCTRRISWMILPAEERVVKPSRMP